MKETFKFTEKERNLRDDILNNIKFIRESFPAKGERIKPCICFDCKMYRKYNESTSSTIDNS